MNDKQKNPSFREQLLSQETTNPDYQKNVQSEAKKMYIEKLKLSQRVAYVLSAGLVGLLVLLFWAFTKVFEELQIQHGAAYIEPLRLASTWAMLLSAVLVVLSLWPAIRGKIGLRLYPKLVRFVFWILILAVVILFFTVFEVIEEQTQSGILPEMVFTMMALVIVMGVYLLLSGRIDRGDIQSKTKLLELEYRLAELEEKFKQ